MLNSQWTVDLGRYQGKQVVSISMDSTMRVWSPKNSEEKLQVNGLKFHKGGVVCLHLLTDGKTALTAGADSLVIMSSIEDGRVYSRSVDLQGDIASVEYFEGWKCVFATTFDGKMVTLDKDTFKILHEETEKSGIVNAKFVESLKCFVVSTSDGSLLFHAYGKTGVINRMKIHSADIHQFEVIQ